MFRSPKSVKKMYRGFRRNLAVVRKVGEEEGQDIAAMACIVSLLLGAMQATVLQQAREVYQAGNRF